ncbi:hypothetical protein EM595_2334 [Duffyella gerundensis]|uniref:Secreted protein n=1 Tax=Duffyella gerundensis TaxID=1619313 RepID=A0A0U5L7V6_9GAMM|nr:hypothetical protein EM595_2334 [Duffyella gerundensis]
MLFFWYALLYAKDFSYLCFERTHLSKRQAKLVIIEYFQLRLNALQHQQIVDPLRQ